MNYGKDRMGFGSGKIQKCSELKIVERLKEL